ncbi:MAG: CBS domain-containing protein [Desulfobulbaceae bacterium]|nr:CBS domain-containing protein [Desulfobulbaceae bacterium]
MKTPHKTDGDGPSGPLSEQFIISDEDIHEAMKEISGYLDITAADFKELYAYSYRHALDRLINSVRAGDIMTRNVVTVGLKTPLQEVADRMASSGITGLPVLDDDGKPAGIISERDFLNHMGADMASFMSIVAACLRGKGCAALGIRKALAGDIMSRPVISIRETTTLAEAAALLSRNSINRLPVLDEKDEKLLGILTRSDLVQAHVFGCGRQQ